MNTSYALRHTTSFEYTAPVTESVMELRMRPASDGAQRCLEFELDVHPRARVFSYTDFLGNTVHHFDVARAHTELAIVTRALVQVDEAPGLPDALPVDTWPELDDRAAQGDHWLFRQPSAIAAWTPALGDFARSAGLTRERGADPLTVVRAAMATIHGEFEYAPESTRVDSPIDQALHARRGVCQDFAHVMIAVLRQAGLPARYVSGYIAPRGEADAPDPSSLATHAWVEVWLPTCGWVGMDPTHNVPAGTGHIRVAVGRDYADVPPTRGTFKGRTDSTLSVAVEIAQGRALPPPQPQAHRNWSVTAAAPAGTGRQEQQQQQQ